MNKVYFVHYDNFAQKRNSDGVELCTIPKFKNGKIFFYCDEYCTVWQEIEDVGNFDKVLDLPKDVKVEPATLIEISKANLISYIDLVKEYIFDKDGGYTTNYIHLYSK